LSRPELGGLIQWLGPDLVTELESRRRKRNEYHRHRKLATAQTLWLMLAVSLETARHSLHEILALAVSDLDLAWSVSVSAFCQARRRFSPRESALAAGPTGRGAESPHAQRAVAGLPLTGH
jgi:hypothetical protein